MADIEFAELHSLVEKNQAKIIDVRDANEIQKDGKILNSINIPKDEVKTAFALSAEDFLTKYGAPKPSPDDENVVFHCHMGRRAQFACEAAIELGYNKWLARGSRNFLIGEGRPRCQLNVPIETVTFAEIISMVEEKRGIIMDVREPQELQETGKIPGSVNVPLGEVTAALQMTPEIFLERFGVQKPDPGDGDIVFTCRSGKRATSAQLMATQVGYARPKVYGGSMLDYLEQKGPIER